MRCIICDVDGTVAIRVNREPFDYSKVLHDIPNKPVVELIQSLIRDNWKVIFVSGREEICREDTTLFLSRLFSTPIELHMRKQGDYRSDAEIKSEIFLNFIKPFHSPMFVLDDRDRTVKMWRDKHNLPTFQVTEGNF